MKEGGIKLIVSTKRVVLKNLWNSNVGGEKNKTTFGG